MNKSTCTIPVGSKRHPLALSIRSLALAGIAIGTASAQNLITNGDFDANASSFVEFPGYLGGANPSSVPGWSFTPGGNPGINGTATPGSGSPFAPATNVPHFLLMQGDFSAEQSIATTNGALYQFSFDAAARNGNQAGVSVFADNTAAASLVLDGFAPSFGWLSQSNFQRFAFGFTATGPQTIRFTSNGVGDHTTDIDQVSVTVVTGAMPISDGTIFFTEQSGTVGYGLHLTGANQAIYQRAGAVTYTGNITTDGSGGALEVRTYGRQVGLQSLTFSGNTIALGGKSFQTSGQGAGNVDSIADANLSLVTLNDVTLTTSANVVVTRSALHLTGNTQATIGGQLVSGNAWNDFTLGGTSSVTVAGGLDFRNVASHLALDGGTLTTPEIWGNFTFGGASRTIFNGTRVIASTDNADFLKMSHDFDQGAHTAAADIADGGAIIDTNNHNITIASDLTNLPGHSGGLTKLGNGTLTIAATAAYSGPTVIDTGTLKLATLTAGAGAVTVANAGFETPDFGAGGWAYTPGGASWNFAAAGIAQNGSPWFVPNAVEGLQGGFLQGSSASISQGINVVTGGQYDLSFNAVGRTQGPQPSNGLKLYIDGHLAYAIGNFAFSQSEWRSFSIPVALSAGAHTLQFAGWDDAGGGDVSTVIDAVSIANGKSGGGTLGSSSAVSIAAAATLDLGGNSQAVGSLSGEGTITSSVAQAGTLFVGADSTNGADFTGVIQNGLGTIALDKIGSGIQALSGNNTFTGSTTISSGVLQINNPASLSTGGVTIRSGGVLYPAFSDTAVNPISLAGLSPVIFADTGTPTLAGSVSNDGSAGTLLIASRGREAGSHILTFSGNTIALGAKSLSLYGPAAGGNVDTLAEANGQLTVLNDATLTTSANVAVRRAALQIAGSSIATIGGQLTGSDAWSVFILQDAASVTASGGVDFRAVASHIELNGGTLITPSIWGNKYAGGVTRTIFNGTQIVASSDNGDFLKISADFNGDEHGSAADLASDGLLIDTNGHTIGIVNDLADLPGNNGVLTKTGPGTLLLSGALNYTGTTNIAGGKLIVASPIGFGNNTVNAVGGITQFDASQILDTLNIGDGAVVELGSPIPAAPAFAEGVPLFAAAPLPVPEPGTATLLFAGSLAMLRRFRRNLSEK